MPPSPPAVPRNAKTMRAIKKLMPHDPGARRWAAEFGDRLLCVRYRVDPERQRRQTTVELVVEEVPTLGGARVGLRVAWSEKDLRQRVKEAGGKWDAQAGLWMLPLGTARRLGLAERIVGGQE
jgi:hypothetical protein